MPRVLVTGASGFIGSELVRSLGESHYKVRAAVRSLRNTSLAAVELCECGHIGTDTTWDECLTGVDVVVHLAGRVHIMDKQDAQDDAAFLKANVAATMHLIEAAVSKSIKRFIYLSSVKVNGEESAQLPFTEQMQVAPKDSYAQSKLIAEKELLEFATQHDIEVVIIRPPLVYGPAAKGNFAALLQVVAKGIPLPLKAIKNQRSMVSVFNLCDLIKVCLDHPAAAGEIFLVSDGADVSTPELIRVMAQAMNLKPRLFYVPVFLLKSAAVLCGKFAMAQRLCGNLQVDISKARQRLQWSPPLSLKEGIHRSV